MMRQITEADVLWKQAVGDFVQGNPVVEENMERIARLSLKAATGTREAVVREALHGIGAAVGVAAVAAADEVAAAYEKRIGDAS